MIYILPYGFNIFISNFFIIFIVNIVTRNAHIHYYVQNRLIHEL